MQPFLTCAAVLAVAVIFYVWRDYWQLRRNRTRHLHERVAYMLWVMAQHVG